MYEYAIGVRNLPNCKKLYQFHLTQTKLSIAPIKSMEK